MAGQLSDDGTMDTVISCPVCGEEKRYDLVSWAEVALADRYPERDMDGSHYTCSDEDAERDYREFVEWAISDFDEEHEQESPECYEEAE